MPAPRRPIVLVHGYSAAGSSFDAWIRKLIDAGYAPGDLHVCSYRSLTNEVSLDDVAQGFERALRIQTGLSEGEPFDAVVHSTGMLVVRAWLAGDPRRACRLRHLIGLAPATFGSPLAHKGRGWLGAVFRGNRELGPDFMEAWDRILDGLELGSRFTWELALADMVGGACFNVGNDTPYAFVFCGTDGYGFPLSVISPDGSDGTVRLAGTAMTTRLIRLDLTLPGEEALSTSPRSPASTSSIRGRRRCWRSDSTANRNRRRAATRCCGSPGPPRAAKPPPPTRSDRAG